jgi:hypothetical protein
VATGIDAIDEQIKGIFAGWQRSQPRAKAAMGIMNN